MSQSSSLALVPIIGADLQTAVNPWQGTHGVITIPCPGRLRLLFLLLILFGLADAAGWLLHAPAGVITGVAGPATAAAAGAPPLKHRHEKPIRPVFGGVRPHHPRLPAAREAARQAPARPRGGGERVDELKPRLGCGRDGRGDDVLVLPPVHAAGGVGQAQEAGERQRVAQGGLLRGAGRRGVGARGAEGL